jgi:hypothetical protein
MGVDTPGMSGCFPVSATFLNFSRKYFQAHISSSKGKMKRGVVDKRSPSITSHIPIYYFLYIYPNSDLTNRSCKPGF